MKCELKSRWTGEVLFSVETDSWRLAVEAAVKAKANLREADLCEANLRGADLRGADLRGADLCEANGIEKFPIYILGHKHFLQTTSGGKLQIGCHIKTLAEWEEHAEEIGKAENYSALDIEIYRLHIAHIAKVSRLLWASKEKEGANV